MFLYLSNVNECADESYPLSVRRESGSAVGLARTVLAEVDFTVQGKVGSCGDCSLGDAFCRDGFYT
jgi:hypothetical protein